MSGESKSALGESAILMDYLPKLLRMVERNMSGSLKNQIAPEEMVQSILGSVIKRARKRKLLIEQSDDFWRLLVAISLNKVRKKARYFGAQKRDVMRQTQLIDDLPTLEEIAQQHGDPTDEDGIDICRMLDELSQRLSDDCRIVLEGKVQQKTNLEIAEQLNKSTKTVARCWQKIQSELARLVDEQIN